MTIEQDCEFFSLKRNFTKDQLLTSYKRMYLEHHPKATVREWDETTTKNFGYENMPDISGKAPKIEYDFDGVEVGGQVYGTRNIKDNVEEDAMFNKVENTFERLKQDWVWRQENPGAVPADEVPPPQYYEMIEGDDYTVRLPLGAEDEGGVLYVMINGEEFQVDFPANTPNPYQHQLDDGYGVLKIEFVQFN